MLIYRHSISVAIVTLAALGRRRSSRPVGDAIGDIGFPFPVIERWENSIGGTPTGSLNPLGGGTGRGCGEHKTSNNYLARGQFHDNTSLCLGKA
jgi:hypothetical protein